MSTGGEVANALVCKTSIRGFDPHPVLHTLYSPSAPSKPMQPPVTLPSGFSRKVRSNKDLAVDPVSPGTAAP